MRWRGRRQSSNIEDRRGGNSGGFRGGFGRGMGRIRFPSGGGRRRVGRRAGVGGLGLVAVVVIAMLLVAVLFAAAHLHTYGWNVAQALMGVGTARIILLLPYIITKNIWVSTGAHILNDWAMFGVSILSTAAATTGGEG